MVLRAPLVFKQQRKQLISQHPFARSSAALCSGNRSALPCSAYGIQANSRRCGVLKQWYLKPIDIAFVYVKLRLNIKLVKINISRKIFTRQQQVFLLKFAIVDLCNLCSLAAQAAFVFTNLCSKKPSGLVELIGRFIDGWSSGRKKELSGRSFGVLLFRYRGTHLYTHVHPAISRLRLPLFYAGFNGDDADPGALVQQQVLLLVARVKSGDSRTD